MFFFELFCERGKFYSFIFLALDIERLRKNKCVKCAVGSFWYETQRLVYGFVADKNARNLDLNIKVAKFFEFCGQTRNCL